MFPPVNACVIIEITRAVRVGIFDAEVQSLKTGEIYRVAPAIGMVLISEGWARPIGLDVPAPVDAVDRADDDPDDDGAGS